MQTKLGAIMAAIAFLCAAALCLGVFRRFDFREFAAYYVEGTLRFYGILIATFLALGASTVGFFLSLNAAGRRRNRLSGLAWRMFFVNAALIMITLCVFVLFWFAREEVYLTVPS